MGAGRRLARGSVSRCSRRALHAPTGGTGRPGSELPQVRVAVCTPAKTPGPPDVIVAGGPVPRLRWPGRAFARLRAPSSRGNRRAERNVTTVSTRRCHANHSGGSGANRSDAGPTAVPPPVQNWDHVPLLPPDRRGAIRDRGRARGGVRRRLSG